MSFKSLYYSTNPLFPHILYIVGILSWFFTIKILCLKFKKVRKDEMIDEYKEELKKIKTEDIHGFMCDLVNESKFSSPIITLYFISVLIILGSALILFDSSKILLCISYVILPILQIVIFKTAKSKLKEKLKNNAVININQHIEIKEEVSYKLTIS